MRHCCMRPPTESTMKELQARLRTAKERDTSLACSMSNENEGHYFRKRYNIGDDREQEIGEVDDFDIEWGDAIRKCLNYLLYACSTRYTSVPYHVEQVTNRSTH